MYKSSISHALFTKAILTVPVTRCIELYSAIVATTQLQNQLKNYAKLMHRLALILMIIF